MPLHWQWYKYNNTDDDKNNNNDADGDDDGDEDDLTTTTCSYYHLEHMQVKQVGLHVSLYILVHEQACIHV